MGSGACPGTGEGGGRSEPNAEDVDDIYHSIVRSIPSGDHRRDLRSLTDPPARERIGPGFLDSELALGGKRGSQIHTERGDFDRPKALSEPDFMV